MCAEPIFIEVQKYRKLWIFIGLIGVLGLFIYALVQQAVFKVPFGDRPIPNLILFLISLIPLFLLVLFINARLYVKMDSVGIFYQFFPFHLRGRQIFWNEVRSAKIRTFSPIREYGGWGVRFSRNGVAYTVRGKAGLQLELTDGKKLLIGTQKPKKVENFLQNLYNF